jgi:hypothetical protein
MDIGGGSTVICPGTDSKGTGQVEKVLVAAAADSCRPSRGSLRDTCMKTADLVRSKGFSMAKVFGRVVGNGYGTSIVVTIRYDSSTERKRELSS